MFTSLRVGVVFSDDGDDISLPQLERVLVPRGEVGQRPEHQSIRTKEFFGGFSNMPFADFQWQTFVPPYHRIEYDLSSCSDYTTKTKELYTVMQLYSYRELKRLFTDFTGLGNHGAQKYGLL